MAQMYRFTDANGEVRLMAEIDPAPGGAVLGRNVGQAEFDFAQDVTNLDGVKHLTLAFADGDVTIADLTDPANPLIVTAGVYAFTVTGAPTSPTDNTWGVGALVDDNFYSITAIPRGRTLASGAAAVVWWCDDGDPFAALGINDEDLTPGAIHLSGRLLVQRIT